MMFEEIQYDRPNDDDLTPNILNSASHTSTITILQTNVINTYTADGNRRQLRLWLR